MTFNLEIVNYAGILCSQCSFILKESTSGSSSGQSSPVHESETEEAHK